MRFTKMHGLGNDYVYVDCSRETVGDPATLARAVSDRHRGVGSDGLILIEPTPDADVRMTMFNADGSRAQMCGNGIRCVARYAFERRLTTANPMRIATDSGVRVAHVVLAGGAVQAVRVDMGRPTLDPAALPAHGAEPLIEVVLDGLEAVGPLTAVSMGNPHAVVFCPDCAAIDLERLGPRVECADLFPERINVHFVTVRQRNRARVITWERGSGRTEACGTGACAVVVAGAVTDRLARRATIDLPGGPLDIEWAPDDTVWMTGPAVEVFSGTWPA